ncbi:branched-chain amino acid ABC transporter permease [Patulibacter sp. S7RM1-6]
MFAQQVVNGLALGSVYALFAVGFGIVFSTMKILNLAQGVYATWGAIAAWWAAGTVGLPFWLAAVVGVIAGALVAVAVDQIAFQPLRDRGAQLLGTIITSIALWIALRELASMATDAAPLGFPPDAVPTWTVDVLGLRLLAMQVIDVVLMVVVTGAIFAFLHRTRIGTAVRAVGYDPDAAAIGGVDPRTATLIGAALAGGATALSGVLLAGSQSFDFALGDGLLLSGFAAVVIGGVGDVRSSAAGGLLVGLVEVLSGQYISSTLQQAIVFGLLLLFLVTRPRGLFGTADLVRA